MTFAELLDAHVYIVHLSCDEALRAAVAAKARGVKVWAETLIQYLLLDKTYAERPNFEGAKYVMSPPLRDKSNQEILWNALRDGVISTLATDHAPFDFATQKRMGEADFTRIPNGIPSLEDRVNAFYTYGVKRGRLDLAPVRGRRQHPGREALRPVPAQRRHPTRQRRRPGGLRPELPRHPLGSRRRR